MIKDIITETNKGNLHKTDNGTSTAKYYIIITLWNFK